ncbi:hypothetical protein G9A89_021982 [Geosiphon pyriformis]|nr:hypothetical protein G9A89_021982 [Geosiphon pyriformis]
MGACCGNNEEYQMTTKKETPIEAAWKRAVQQLDSCPHDNDKIWRIAITKIEGALPEEIREIKDNPPESIELDWNSEPVINLLNSEQFHKHYQELALIREEQKQRLKEINTRLCDYCLIPCDFQYYNKCDLIYNPLPCMIYTIPEEKKPINSCTSELESTFNPNSNSNNNNNKNNGSSSTQCGNEKYNDLNSDSNPETYIALPNLTKEQELK